MEGCSHYRRAGGYCARHTTSKQATPVIAPLEPPAVANTQPTGDVFVFECGTPTSPSWLDAIDWSVALMLLEETTRSDGTNGFEWPPKSEMTASPDLEFASTPPTNSALCVTF
ncbi:hypothetical protein Ae201684P_019620 [Aphanomyces euteiches]|nr:hypothetical protein Ae201684P_019620 [Aphanomyces euteiches]